MSEAFLYEFLFRGRAADDPEPPAWHVILGQVVRLPGAREAQFVDSGALTPAQAAAAGFPLERVLAGIEAAALADRDATAAALSAMTRERDALREALAAVTAERDALRSAAADA
ncbi:hypothetical protein [Methylobacterium sp. ID0610]|uniref:hypothetical protein n=1 Tax=Methylobacterium carpenticola TaxID=3344827 RepID=UPI0036AC40FB